MGFFFFFMRIAFSIFSYTLAPSREMSPFCFFFGLTVTSTGRTAVRPQDLSLSTHENLPVYNVETVVNPSLLRLGWKRKVWHVSLFSFFFIIIFKKINKPGQEAANGKPARISLFV